VVASLLTNRESALTGSLKSLTGEVLEVLSCNLWNGVFVELSEICEDKPAKVGGQTTAGKDSVYVFDEVVASTRFAKPNTMRNIVMN
jgi:hypothetical protein